VVLFLAASYPINIRVSFPEEKWPGFEYDYSFPFSVMVKNATSAKQKDIFTFTLHIVCTICPIPVIIIDLIASVILSEECK
jgi:hypothetical protein